MSDHHIGSLPAIHAPVLSATVLARIHELNRDFIELLVAEHAIGPSDPFWRLPGSVVGSLSKLSDDAKASLAATSYALYSLRFEKVGFWRAAATLPDHPIAARYGVSSAMPLQAAFCEVALILAWHIATVSPVAARVLYAMPDAIVAQLPLIPLWQLKRVAADFPGILMPRWPNNPCFWPDLVRFAAGRDVHRLSAAQLLGNQLIALELETTAGARSHPRSGILRSSRLHVRRM